MPGISMAGIQLTRRARCRPVMVGRDPFGTLRMRERREMRRVR